MNSGAIRDVNRLFHSQAAGPKYQTLVFSSWATGCSINRANLGEVELLVADQGLTPRVRNRHANLVLADAFGFELPAADRLELGKRNPEVVAS